MNSRSVGAASAGDSKTYPTLINGEQSDCLPIADRGLQYGDGVFETMLVNSGHIPLLSRHLSRLQLGLQRLQINPLSTDFPEQLQSYAQQWMPTGTGVLKCIVTRGQGARGYAPPADTVPSVIVSGSAFTLPDDFTREHGVRVRLCQQTLAHSKTLAGCKHLNRLEQVLARSEWQDPMVYEGLMQDAFGNVIEGTKSNLFFVRNNVAYTPDLSMCGVAGVMRAELLESIFPALDVRCEIGSYSLQDLQAADECLLCNSLIGVLPVSSIEDSPFSIGSIGTAAVQAARHSLLGQRP